jgi:hypothetical protein
VAGLDELRHGDLAAFEPSNEAIESKLTGMRAEPDRWWFLSASTDGNYAN